ncbi:10088_t:CDS:2, partial [Ambispora leptoticha]
MSTTKFDVVEHSHRRFNPLLNSWVLCSPHRTKRPWQGQVEAEAHDFLPEFEPSCYLCPGNARAQGGVNPNYENTFIFDNDFAAVRKEQPEFSNSSIREKFSSLLRLESVRGECKVICYSPKHNITMAEMTESSILEIIKLWILTYLSLSIHDHISYIQIFENKGSIMGCSNPHPHGQIWCTSVIPEEPSKEISSMSSYHDSHGSCLLCDYVSLETTVSNNITNVNPISAESNAKSNNENNSRLVCENNSFVCLIPFWAIWPFETIIISKQHVTKITDLNEQQQSDFANIMRRITCRYDNLFKCSFPYSMGIHQAPVDSAVHDLDSHLHVHFYPPLLRSPTIKKFMVGYELLAEPQRDLTPEQAATRL